MAKGHHDIGLDDRMLANIIAALVAWRSTNNRDEMPEARALLAQSTDTLMNTNELDELLDMLDAGEGWRDRIEAAAEEDAT